MLDKKSLKSSAAEMLYFMNNFPFIIDGLIDDECSPVWYLYMALRDILSILLSFYIHEDIIKYLEQIISEHHIIH